MDKTFKKEYIEGKEKLPTIKTIGVVHIHSGGYYSDQCPGCWYENSELADIENEK